MTRFGVRLLVAVLAFGLGLLAHSAWRGLQQSQFSSPVIEQQRLPSEDFVGTGIVSMFKEHYRRESDGAWVRFGCFVSTSEAVALNSIQNVDPARVIQRTDVLDIKGSKIGERVVLADGEPSTSALIEWNEGSRVFIVAAQSVADAISFENSKVWVGAGCLDLHSY